MLSKNLDKELAFKGGGKSKHLKRDVGRSENLGEGV